MASIDWAAIKAEYINGGVSQRKLAEKYGVNHATIGKHCKAEGWVQSRRQMASKRQAKIQRKSADREDRRLDKLVRSTEAAVDVAMAALNDKQQFNRYLVQRRESYAGGVMDEDGNAISERQWTEEITSAKVDTKALKDLTGVLKDLTGLLRDFYSIPTPAQAEAQRIAAERLAMDKAKAEAEADADQSDRIEVILEGAGPEEWNE